MVLAAAVVKLPETLRLRFWPTVEFVKVTEVLLSSTLAEPAVLTARVGAETLVAVMLPEPEATASSAPDSTRLPAAVSVMLPAPLAVNVTSPVADSVPSTVILPLPTVEMVAVPAFTLPVIMVSVPDDELRVDADKAPPRFNRVPAIRCAAAEAAIAPVVSRVVPALTSSEAAEIVPPRVI